MKRIFAIIVVLVVVLGVVLGLRLRHLAAYRNAPPGGTGTIEGTEVNITARISARILGVKVHEGDAVTSGQLLVELDCADQEAALAEARARLATAVANVEVAEASASAAKGSTSAAKRTVLAAAAERRAAEVNRSYISDEATRLRKLHQSGAITGAQLDEIVTRSADATQRTQAVEANREAAEARAAAAYRNELAAAAQIEAAKTTVQALKALVRRADLMVAECRLISPLAGVVLTRSFEPGEVVLPGANLLTLIDLSEVRATFYLPNAELAAAAPGRKAAVRADAYPGEVFAGTIKHVAAKAEFTPKNVQTREDRDRLVYAVEVTIPNRNGRLRPGMPVEVTIEGTGR
jgi:HlyD family secretion protein